MASNGHYEEVTIAGFGGQGIIIACKLLAQTTMNAGKEVTFMPSYGAEVRGGTANGMVIIADGPIASPVVSRPDSLIAMNKASLNKFAPRVKKGGLIIINKSLVDSEPRLDESIEVIRIPADDIAHELGSDRSANMVALGAYLQRKGMLSCDAAADCLGQVLAERYHVTIPVNTKALHRGREFVAEQTG